MSWNIFLLIHFVTVSYVLLKENEMTKLWWSLLNELYTYYIVLFVFPGGSSEYDTVDGLMIYGSNGNKLQENIMTKKKVTVSKEVKHEY